MKLQIFSWWIMVLTKVPIKPMEDIFLSSFKKSTPSEVKHEVTVSITEMCMQKLNGQPTLLHTGFEEVEGKGRISGAQGSGSFNTTMHLRSLWNGFWPKTTWPSLFTGPCLLTFLFSRLKRDMKRTRFETVEESETKIAGRVKKNNKKWISKLFWTMVETIEHVYYSQ